MLNDTSFQLHHSLSSKYSQTHRTPGPVTVCSFWTSISLKLDAWSLCKPPAVNRTFSLTVVILWGPWPPLRISCSLTCRPRATIHTSILSYGYLGISATLLGVKETEERSHKRVIFIQWRFPDRRKVSVWTRNMIIQFFNKFERFVLHWHWTYKCTPQLTFDRVCYILHKCLAKQVFSITLSLLE
jgi:hypothetical protein